MVVLCNFAFFSAEALQPKISFFYFPALYMLRNVLIVLLYIISFFYFSALYMLWNVLIVLLYIIICHIIQFCLYFTQARNKSYHVNILSLFNAS